MSPRRLVAALLLIGSCAIAPAQTSEIAEREMLRPSRGIDGQSSILADASAGRVTGPGASPRSLEARRADGFDVRDYGAIGDGKSHPVSSVLGVSSLEALAGYSINGVTSYAWVSSYPFGTLFNLPIAQTAARGATTLNFGTSKATGSAATAAGAYTIVMADITGLHQGQTIGGAFGLAAGTQVDLVNPATSTIRLSVPTRGTIAAATRLSFVHSWIGKVAVGMQVTGPGVPGGDVVSSVDASTGAVVVSAAIQAAANPVTPNTAPTPYPQSTQITFYAPYTDAQASALEMDGLGINAAIQAATAKSGAVMIPAGRYSTNLPIIEPLTGSVSLVGAQALGTSITGTVDLGPGTYLVSCGDPTATAANARGVYAAGGTICDGAWQDLSITTGAIPLIGRRPQLAGVPIAMSGFRQGPRRKMVRVNASGFNKGIEFQGDWTQWDYVFSTNNFVGFRLGDSMTILYDDLHFNNTFFGGDAFAGVSISATAQLQGYWTKSWLADQPYAIWMEPGAGGINAIADTVFRQMNFEGAGCATVIDGNTNKDTTAQIRGVVNVSLDTSNFLQNPVYALPEGCAWNAYFDMNYAYGLSITNIPNANLMPVDGGTSIVRIRSDRSTINNGGVLLSGSGMQNIAQAYASKGQEIVTGYNGVDGAFGRNGSERGVSIESDLWKARVFGLVDPNSGLSPIGLLFEGSNYFDVLSVQRAGTATSGTRSVIGSSILATTARTTWAANSSWWRCRARSFLCSSPPHKRSARPSRSERSPGAPLRPPASRMGCLSAPWRTIMAGRDLSSIASACSDRSGCRRGLAERRQPNGRIA